MGYFSDLSIHFSDDLSYPSPEIQLRCRIEDLFMRLLKVSFEEKSTQETGDCFSQEDYCYADPKYFKSERDIIIAIAMARHKLASYQQELCDPAPIREELPGQITIWEYLKARNQPLAA